MIKKGSVSHFPNGQQCTITVQWARQLHREKGMQESKELKIFFLTATSAMNLVCLKYKITHFPKSKDYQPRDSDIITVSSPDSKLSRTRIFLWLKFLSKQRLRRPSSEMNVRHISFRIHKLHQKKRVLWKETDSYFKEITSKESLATSF